MVSSCHLPAGGAIRARIATASADVLPAQRANVSLRATTNVVPGVGVVTRGAVHAGGTGARHHGPPLTVGAAEAYETATRVGEGAVSTSAAVLTRPTQARRVDGQLAPTAGKPARTLTRKVLTTATYICELMEISLCTTALGSL